MEGLLQAAWKHVYGGQEWHLVQTFLMQPSGQLSDLWVPKADEQGARASELRAALASAIQRMGLKEQPPLVVRTSTALRPGESKVFEAILRYDFPKDSLERNRHSFGLDRVSLTREECARLLPPGQAPYQVDPGVAARLLVSLRPPLEAALDLEEDALRRVVKASLRGTPLPGGQDSEVVALEGSLAYVRPFSEGPAPPDTGKWSDLLQVDLEVKGYLTWDPRTREIQDLWLLTRNASALLPGRKKLSYRGMLHPRQEPAR